MIDRTRQRVADDTADTLTRIANHLHAKDVHDLTVIDRIRDAMNGHPRAQHLEQDRTTGHTTVTDEDGQPMPAVTDPVGETATADADGRGDQAATDLHQLDRDLAQLQRLALRVERTLARYTPRPATAGERRKAAAANDREPGCESCARIPQGDGTPRWEPPNTKEPTDVAGNLAEPMWLDWWCYRWVTDTGRLPSLNELRAHHDGRKVRRPAA